MTLSGGTRLGPYEIIEPLGAGGMGEVYKSRDTRLERTVAVKVVSASLASDPTWRQRFDREARILAALSNPHICPIFDVGRHDGVDFLVMEYLDGETLTARLARGPLPVDLALRHAIEIADGLAAAHREGVSHRDLKPGNIMLTRSGARLLDFGLARGGPLRSHPSDHPTISSGLTATGTILGTVQYMAPEQLEGKETDARTDIFAFGSVVYEMVTGRKAFEGQSQASVIAAILEQEPPPISSLQRMAPPAFDRAVKKCLAKDPEERWQNARDLRDELKWIAEGSSQTGVPVTVAVRRKRWALLSWSLIATLAAALLTLAAVHFRQPAADVSRVVFTVARPGSRANVLWGAAPELAPDGKRLVFPGPTPAGRSVLWVRSLDSLTARPLAGTESEWPAAFWSPDGQSIGFFADGKLKRIDVSGGPAHTLANAPDNWGGTWSPAGIIVFSPRAGPLFQVSASGGPATPALELDRSRQEISHSWPHFLPDGRHFLYVVASADASRHGVYLASLDSKQSQLLIRESDGAVFSPPGYLVFARGRTLFAQAFDLGKMQIAGEAFAIPGQDGQVITTEWSLFSASRNGVLSYVSTRPRAFRLSWYDRKGKVLETIGDPAPYASFALSPDEKRLALDHADGQIWVLELASGIATRHTLKSSGGDPVWSPDSRQLVFTVFEGFTGNLYRKVIAGGSEEPLFKSGENKYAQQWSNDGTSILFMNQDGTALYRLPVSGDPKPQMLVQDPSTKDEFRLSPDGRWIAYNSLESGRWEVYVASFPSFGGKRQVSSGGGCQAHWRRDGKELFYLDLQGKLMAVDVTTGPSFEATAPRPLFQTPIPVNPVIDQYVVSGDGRKFILGMPLGEEEPITVMLNWTAGLKQ
jgi:Tol biopolymer transport system component